MSLSRSRWGRDPRRLRSIVTVLLHAEMRRCLAILASSFSVRVRRNLAIIAASFPVRARSGPAIIAAPFPVRTRGSLAIIAALFLVGAQRSLAISERLVLVTMQPVGSASAGLGVADEARPSLEDSVSADSSAFRGIDDAVAEHATDEGGEELFEELSWLADHPLDLNAVTAGELLQIPGVLPADADALVQWRRRVGAFTDVGHLRRIGGAGRRLHFLLAPFVRVESPEGLFARGRSRCVWKQNGQDTDRADSPPGPMSQEHHRIDFRLWGRIDGGARLHRDAGEPYKYASLTGAMRITAFGGLDELIVGDYRASAASGLVLGSASGGAYGMFRGQRADSRLEPYYGSSGRGLLRGAALSKTLRFRNGTFTLQALLSRVPLSASLDSAGRIRSIDESSVFSSASSIQKRHNAAETAAGLRACYTATRGYSIGATIFRTVLSRPTAGATPYQRPQSSGIVGVDGHLESGAVSLSGEYAWGRDGSASAGCIGVELDSHTALELMLWHYGPGYWCSTAGGTSSGNEVRNDAGVRASWTGRISRRVTWSGYLQHWRRPWRTSMDSSPPSGLEGSVSVAVRPAPRIVCEGRYAHSRSEHTEPCAQADGLQAAGMEIGTRNHVRCSVDIVLAPMIGLRARMDWCHVAGAGTHGGEKGWSLAQDIRFGWEGFPRVFARFMIVETDSYAARLYAQERDVEGAYTNPPCYGSGIRWYILLRQPLTRAFAVSAKYASSATASGAFLNPPANSLTLQIDFLTGSE